MDDFQPAAVEAGSYQGRLYSIIRDFYPGPAMFYYNKDLFDKAGIAYPTFDWNWDKMREAANALTLDTNGDGKLDQWGLAFEVWIVTWLHWIWSNGGDLFSKTRPSVRLPSQRPTRRCNIGPTWSM
jgi:multiple sugar transport system substrate-binding protein